MRNDRMDLEAIILTLGSEGSVPSSAAPPVLLPDQDGPATVRS